MRCLIADDNPGFLETAKALLECQGIPVVGVACTAAEAARLVRELRPDVVLIDIDLGEESGFDLARRLLENGDVPPAGVILISSCAESDLADLIAAGDVPFLSKAVLSGDAIRDIVLRTSEAREA